MGKPRLLVLLAIVGVVAMIVLPFVQNVTNDPLEDDVEGWIEAWNGVGLQHRAVEAIRQLACAEPANISYHYRWITSHFSLPDYSAKKSRDDDQVKEYYVDLAENEQEYLANIGRYGLGLIDSVHDGDRERALEKFAAVSDQDMLYLNNSIGFCLLKLSRADEAIRYFEREIELGGNIGGASGNLAAALFDLDQIDQLAARCEADSGFRDRLSVATLRRLAVARTDVAMYFDLVLTGRLSRVIFDGFLAALVILGIWLVFLWRLDLFEPERPLHLVLTLGLGMAMVAGPTTILYDLMGFGFGAEPGGGALNTLIYCVFVVGLIEESIKLIPLLIVVRCTKWVDEPVDIVIYGATSALGFAFMENLLYFGPQGLAQIHGRAFTATVLHMALTAIASYGLLKAKAEGRSLRSGFKATLGWFAVAVFMHGLYDFFLLVDGWLALVRLLALLVLFFAVSAFRSIVINGLSWSPFWSDTLDQRLVQRWWYLGLSLSAVVFFEYLLLALRFGPTAARLGFLSAAMASWFLVFVLLGLLGLIPVVRYKWLPLFDLENKR